MTVEQRVALYLFALVFVWAIYQMMLPKLKCHYCGGLIRCEPDCPYRI